MEFFNVLLNEAATVLTTFYGIFINLPWVDLIKAIIDVLPNV